MMVINARISNLSGFDSRVGAIAIIAIDCQILYNAYMASSNSETVTMNVSLPGRLKTYVDGKVASGVYGSTSEFVREAIREKLQRDIERQQARSAVAGKLIEGIESGDPIEFDDQYFARKKQTLLRRHGKKKRA